SEQARRERADRRGREGRAERRVRESEPVAQLGEAGHHRGVQHRVGEEQRRDRAPSATRLEGDRLGSGVGHPAMMPGAVVRARPPRPTERRGRGHTGAMRIGAVYPQTELGGDPEAVRRIGIGVEQLGFDHLLAYDHVLGAVQTDRDPPLAGPYDETVPFHDPLVMFGYLAALTERIELVTGILVLPQRQTALVARQAADVDLLSGGRLRLGVGVGWNWVEYQALGQDFHTRGLRQEEQIELMRRLWTEPVVEHHGRFDVVDRAALVPRPNRTIPVWMGGFGPAAFARAAALAAGVTLAGP